jgi:hypothetical protein
VKVTEFALKSASAPGALALKAQASQAPSKSTSSLASALAEPRLAAAPDASGSGGSVGAASGGSSSGSVGLGAGASSVSAGSAAGSAEAGAHRYRYLVWVPLTRGFQEMEQRFQQYPDALAWNTLDQLILSEGQDPQALRQRNTKHKRLLFAVLPPPLDALPDWGARWLEVLRGRLVVVAPKAVLQRLLLFVLCGLCFLFSFLFCVCVCV